MKILHIISSSLPLMCCYNYPPEELPTHPQTLQLGQAEDESPAQH